MKSVIYGMLAETPIHPGSGQDTGFVDLPVAREAATSFPVITGSSMKGALKEQLGEDRETLFGMPDNAGELLISDAKLVMLPVRSLNGSYKWITCPYILERIHRDSHRVMKPPFTLPDLNISDGDYLGSGEGDLFLEERQFGKGGDLPEGLVETLSLLITHEKARARLSDQLVVLSDNSFTWFARFGLSVNARNVLDEETKESKNLWYEETLPPDSLFYVVFGERSPGAVDQMCRLLDECSYIRVGGNETVGQGWFVCSRVEEQ